MVDYAISLHHHWYFLGCGFTLWLTWQLSTAAGLLFGASVPAGWDIDFAVPLAFIALLTLLMRERAGQAAAAPGWRHLPRWPWQRCPTNSDWWRRSCSACLPAYGRHGSGGSAGDES